MAAGVVGTEALPVVVFTCIVATIAIFSVGLPFAARRSVRTAEPSDAASPATAEGVTEGIPELANGVAMAVSEVIAEPEPRLPTQA
jgi:hypothetical protein